MNQNATIILEDGNQFVGKSFGSVKNVSGEIVFHTSMVGYNEGLTDPSYLGQLLVLTYPIIGNYGVPSRNKDKNGISNFLESNNVQPLALIINSYTDEYSHWNADVSLSDWLIEESIVGIAGIDTRAIAKIIRERGTMKAKIVFDNLEDINFVDSNLINQVDIVSCKNIITYNDNDADRKRVVLIDCGVKHDIIRGLIKRNLCVIRVPWDYDFNTLDFDGLVISNGPGNPDFCDKTVLNIKKVFNTNKPICGICMGNQLLAKAGGAKIYKLKYGHRSDNQPVRMVGTNNCFITSQNHGYAVDDSTLENDWEVLFVNMTDGTNEGIRHKNKPFVSVQFHPERSSGITDTEFLFDNFVKTIRK
ncbi:MAG: glutamine-hydrolyzing carbamoyl-phosphate synthase small subunit [Bacteroidetes bacterium]|nr:glutamine-hydrolyzing carbamoyl-phosphate synthase small subunit [Bacteroidota bacterium]